jgi:hypothetical protein
MRVSFCLIFRTTIIDTYHFHNFSNFSNFDVEIAVLLVATIFPLRHINTDAPVNHAYKKL